MGCLYWAVGEREVALTPWAYVTGRDGKLRAPTRDTVRQAGEALVAGMKDGSIRKRGGTPYKPSTIRSYEQSLRNHVYPELGGRRLSDVVFPDLQDLVDDLAAEGLDGSTIRNAINPLRVHPAQQAFISAEMLADCFGDPSDLMTSNPGAKLRVSEVYDEPWKIPGTERTEPSKAVTVEIVHIYSEDGQEIQNVLATFTQHAYKGGDGWVWIVNEDTAESARDDTC